jgi:L-aminopeptidase/D-esterase-like protein
VDVRGAAPGTRETDLLDPVNSIEHIHAVMLSGGSAFGLDAAAGVMRFLEERRIGYRSGPAVVPIVPAAVLFDLRLGDSTIRPTADSGYRAAAAATDAAVVEGNVGAGAGATTGKLAGHQRAMKSGIGSAATVTSDGLIVAVLVAANPFGSIVDPGSGQVIAGVRTVDGKGLLGVPELLSRLLEPLDRESPENTTLAVVATNARLSKAQATQIAQMAHDGFARAIYPAHTPVDGDTIFTLATGTFPGNADVMMVGTLAAQVTADAVVRAARSAASIPGYPASRDLRRSP